MSVAVDAGGSTLDWFECQVERAIGRRSAAEQIMANVLLGAFLIISSSVGLVAMLLLVPVAALGFTFGVLRLWSTFDRYWPVG